MDCTKEDDCQGSLFGVVENDDVFDEEVGGRELLALEFDEDEADERISFTASTDSGVIPVPLGRLPTFTAVSH